MNRIECERGSRRFEEVAGGDGVALRGSGRIDRSSDSVRFVARRVGEQLCSVIGLATPLTNTSKGSCTPPGSGTRQLWLIDAPP